jgi:hypothetical protein
MAALGAPPRQHSAAVGGFHARAKPVGLGALSIVRLKSTFGHGNPSLRVQSKWKRIGQNLGTKNLAKDALLVVH